MKASTAIAETSWMAGPPDSSPTRPSWMAPSSRRIATEDSHDEHTAPWVRPSQSPAVEESVEDVVIPAPAAVPLMAVDPPPAAEAAQAISQVEFDDMVAHNASEIEARDQRIAQQQEQLVVLQEQLDSSLRAMASLREHLVRESEGDLVKLALAMAKKLVGQQLTQTPELVAVWAKEALGRLAEHEDLELCIAADLAQSISSEMWFAQTGVTPIVDDSLDPGSCLVRWPEGHVNVSREARIQALEQSLQPLLPTPNK